MCGSGALSGGRAAGGTGVASVDTEDAELTALLAASAEGAFAQATVLARAKAAKTERQRNPRERTGTKGTAFRISILIASFFKLSPVVLYVPCG
jgi:hypothetical protein